MDNPRPEKVAVVEEVREKLLADRAVVFTEYRGLTVRDLQDLRGDLREAGGEYKVYKNTLVRRATAELDLDLGETLIGPHRHCARRRTSRRDTPVTQCWWPRPSRRSPRSTQPGDQGRTSGRRDARCRRHPGARRHRSPRGAAGASRRWHCGPHDEHGPPAAGRAPEDGLRALRPHRGRWCLECTRRRRCARRAESEHRDPRQMPDPKPTTTTHDAARMTAQTPAPRRHRAERDRRTNRSE